MKIIINSFLYPISILFKIIVFIKNYCFDNVLKSNQLPCFVISVGNITVGGTGKTPMVLYLCKTFQKHNQYKIGVLSRGYKRHTKGTILVSKGNGPIQNWESVGDEPFMMAKKTKNIPIVVDSNRYRAGQFLIKNFGTEIIILDDGFQHRFLSRDLDIVMINGNTPPSDYKYFPAGNLREGWESIRRADAVIFTKNKPRSFLLNKIKKTNIPFFNSKLKSFILFPKNPPKREVKNLKGKKVVLLCGIGDPKSFEKTIESYDCIVKGLKFFRDHYFYNKKNISKIIEFAKIKKANYILTTEKDWVKIEPFQPDFPFIIIQIEIEILEKNKMNTLIKDHIKIN
tara:strand:+ start:776 stop:1798 length:1023 start_codon:yes stop_codon:yes gene_type:complete